MFNNCKKIIDLDLSNFNTKSVINMNYIFNGCHSLRNIFSRDQKILELKN